MDTWPASVGHFLCGLRGKKTTNQQRVLLIPPAAPGNLGDAATLDIAIQKVRQAGIDQVDILSGHRWNLRERIDKHIAAENYFYRQSCVQQALIISRLGCYSECYFLGAGVIDGGFNPQSAMRRIAIATEAARLGKKTAILSASFAKKSEKKTAEALRRLPAAVAICANDPFSKERLEMALDRPIRQVANLAFLLKPWTDHPQVVKAKAWIDHRKTSGDYVIGLNANYLHAEKDPNIPRALRILVERLLRYNVSLMLIPHDTRSITSDQKLLEEATAAMLRIAGERIYLLPPICPAIVRAVTPVLDFMVSGRLHPVILALSGVTPALCFAYQDKFNGLYNFFKLEDAELLSSPAELSANPGYLGEKIMEKIKYQDLLRDQIRHYLPQVKDLAEKNFNG